MMSSSFKTFNIVTFLVNYYFCYYFCKLLYFFNFNHHQEKHAKIISINHLKYN